MYMCIHTSVHTRLTMQLLARATTVTTQEATFHIPSASIGISALCLYPALSCGRPTHLSRSYVPCGLQTHSTQVIFTPSLSLSCQYSHSSELQYTWRTFMKPLNTLI